jgi:hypothetical protein
LSRILIPEEVWGNCTVRSFIICTSRPHSFCVCVCVFDVGISEYVFSTEGRMTGEWWIVRALEGSDCSSSDALTKNLCRKWGKRRKSTGSKQLPVVCMYTSCSASKSVSLKWAEHVASTRGKMRYVTEKT